MKKIKSFYVLALSITVLIFSCKDNGKKEPSPKSVPAVSDNSYKNLLPESNFDTVIDGKSVKLYWLHNKDLTLAITNYGGRLVGLWTPDKNGKMTDVLIGRGSTKAYVEGPESYFGATIGRVGNRIAKGKFKLDGKAYSIVPNNNENALHGGEHGFQDKVWNAEQPNDHTLVLYYTSPDMEEGFPGNLTVKVTYSLTDDDEVKMEYEATTDQATIVNLTNHAYWNLNGEGNGTILDHSLVLYADKFTPVDAGLIPTGELRDVGGTPFNFTSAHTIGERIATDNEQLKYGGGYDHNFVLNGTEVGGLNHAATVVGDKSGIAMDIYTEEPGIQFYSGNFMAGANLLKSGAKDDYRTAFALETQHFPDAPNQPNFPPIELRPGETYHTVSIYKFSDK
ncbi:galactose mutarotase [Flavobacteriaceae bacterium F89]|uniref:Aldose 1-epimerase n=1 Tax=Cerina litoralis TaxID=2874477 RepID=A0AAE3JSH7_9FLAO|nr:aldose epimerase family protein [Cerina litoralis]MCG2462523.1 galactose mutarotase [Cerina litoralis]